MPPRGWARPFQKRILSGLNRKGLQPVIDIYVPDVGGDLTAREERECRRESRVGKGSVKSPNCYLHSL